MLQKQNTSFRRWFFLTGYNSTSALSLGSGISLVPDGLTGLSIGVQIAKDGNTVNSFSDPAGGATTLTEASAGWYYTDFTAADADTLGALKYLLSWSGNTLGEQDQVVVDMPGETISGDVTLGKLTVTGATTLTGAFTAANAGNSIAGVSANVTQWLGVSPAGTVMGRIQSFPCCGNGTLGSGSTTTSINLGTGRGSGSTVGMMLTCVMPTTAIPESRLVTAYDSSTGLATVDHAYPAAPSNGAAWAISPQARTDVAAILGTASTGAAGYVGIDWGHVNAPTTAVVLSGTTVGTLTTYTGNTPQTGDGYAVVNDASFGNAKLVRSTTPANTLSVDSSHLVAVPDTQKVDLNTIKTQTVSCAGGVTVPAATLASTTNITAAAGCAVSSIGTGVITAASIAADAITASKIADGAIDAGALAADCITAAKIATDAIDADALAADAVAEIQSGLALATTALSTTQWTNSLATNLGTLAGHDPGATLASRTNITAGTITTVTGVTGLTAAAIATAIFTDTTASDFAVAGSPGKILVTQLGGTFTTTSSSVLTTASLANAPGGGGSVTVGGYASGQDPNTLIAAGSVGTQVAAIKTKTDLITSGGVVNVSTPVAVDGDVSLVPGDDYLAANGRSLQWAGSTANVWPDLTGAAIVFTVYRGGHVYFAKAGTVLVPTGMQLVKSEPTASDTSNLTAGQVYSYHVTATLSGGSVATLTHGKVRAIP